MTSKITHKESDNVHPPLAVEIIATSYGSFTVHEKSCNIIDRDWNMHGVCQYSMAGVRSVQEIAEEMINQGEARQDASKLINTGHSLLGITMKRVICHTCARHLEGSGIKLS